MRAVLAERRFNRTVKFASVDLYATQTGTLLKHIYNTDKSVSKYVEPFHRHNFLGIVYINFLLVVMSRTARDQE